MIIRGPILNPRGPGRVDFLPDGILFGDAFGRIAFVGEYDRFMREIIAGSPAPAMVNARGLIIPGMIDAHTHVPQHPIRGRFAEGIAANPPEGRLIAGLNRNVFPAEGRFDDETHARLVIAQFLQDTISQGVVAGAAYLTVHPRAARAAMEMLPPAWHAGLVLMNRNCPQYLRNDPSTVETDLRALAELFGPRAIVTDRFAVACDSELRRIGVRVAHEFGLRTQTHLNEQTREKAFVEQQLYPRQSYAGVYRSDGLLDHRAIVAHCIHMRAEEWQILTDTPSVIAHCPTSNLLLGSGVMNLDAAMERKIDYALCTDVGASPSTSMLLEMSQFLHVHQGRSTRATPQEALYRATLAPARILGLDRDLGSFEVGKEMTFVEVDTPAVLMSGSVDDIIARSLLAEDSLGAQTPETIERLARNAAVEADALDAMTAECRRRAGLFEARIARVTVAGEVIC